MSTATPVTLPSTLPRTVDVVIYTPAAELDGGVLTADCRSYADERQWTVVAEITDPADPDTGLGGHLASARLYPKQTEPALERTGRPRDDRRASHAPHI